MTVYEGKFFMDGELKDTAVSIEDGKIVSTGYEGKRSGSVKKLPGIILPGFTDPHVHFREPGMTQKEDFSSGTLSSLHAGVTCVLEMPNTIPPVTDTLTFKDKKNTIKKKAHVDYGLFAAFTRDIDVTRMAPMVAGFKLFMGSTTGNILMNDQREIENKVIAACAAGRIVSVHAEDDSMIIKGDESSNEDHLRNRPLEAELNAVRRLNGLPVNICHATSSETVDMANSQGMSMEVTAHHLLLNCNDPDPSHKVNPPLRTEAVRKGLMDSFLSGKVTMIGSDHAPHTTEDRSHGYGGSPSGIASAEVTIPMILDMVRTGGLPLRELVRMASAEPARIFSIPKGRIVEGYDADLVAIDLNDVRRIKGNELHGMSEHCVYEGRNAVFPKTVMVRGNIQICDGEFCGETLGEDIRG